MDSKLDAWMIVELGEEFGCHGFFFFRLSFLLCFVELLVPGTSTDQVATVRSICVGRARCRVQLVNLREPSQDQFSR